MEKIPLYGSSPLLEIWQRPQLYRNKKNALVQKVQTPNSSEPVRIPDRPLECGPEISVSVSKPTNQVRIYTSLEFSS